MTASVEANYLLMLGYSKYIRQSMSDRLLVTNYFVDTGPSAT